MINKTGNNNNNNNNNNNKWIILLLLVFSIGLITSGITYGISNNNAKEDKPKENIINEEVRFSYTENQKGININDAMPVSDAVGKTYISEGQVFDFSIEAVNNSNESIPYEITFTQKGDSTLPNDAIKIYLTDITEGADSEILQPILYSKLIQTNIDVGSNIEKTIYTGTVNRKELNYLKKFRLRVWIDENIQISSDEYKNKKFIGLVNVYSSGKLISEEEISLRSDINISSVIIEEKKPEEKIEVIEKPNYKKTQPSVTPSNNNEIINTVSVKDTDNTLKNLNLTGCDLIPTFSSGKTDYTCTVKSTVEKTIVSAEATSSKATIEGIGKRILKVGKNKIDIVVTAENGSKKTYTVTITKLKDTDNTLKNLSLTDCNLSPSFSSSNTDYTCIVKSTVEKTIVSAEATSIKAEVEGIGKKSLSTGDNTITITVTAENGTTRSYKIVVTKTTLLKNEIMKQPLITAEPTLTNSSNNTSDQSGLYKSTDTNSGEPTYYFRGNIENNYVKFAGYTWRIIRINEDGTIRIIMQNAGINHLDYKFSTTFDNKSYIYYTNSDISGGAKYRLDAWYKTNITDKGYSDKIVTGDYFCEQAKVAYSSYFAKNSGATMTAYFSYKPNFKCEIDENGKGVVNGSIGLITYDEVAYAGGYYINSNDNYYLKNGYKYWTMSPAGVSANYYGTAYVWLVDGIGAINHKPVNNYKYLRPVLNLKSDIAVTGTGTSTDPWEVVF